MELFRLFGTIGLNGVEETQEDIDETTEHAEDAEGKMSNAFKKIGTAIVTYLAVDKIVEFGKSIVDASATVSAEVSAFEQIMGDYSDNAQNKLDEIANATGVVSTRLTPYMTSMTAKFKGLGYDIDKATTLASDGLMLASDASAFWDKSLEDSMSALNSFINGSYEGGEAIGLFANDTQLASYAVKEGIVKETKEWANLNEAKKQATRLEYAKKMYEMSGATGQASKEADQYANVQANLTEHWRQFKAVIGTPVLQAVLPVMKGFGDGVKYVTDTLKNANSLGEGFSQIFSNLVTSVQKEIPKFVEQASTMMKKFGEEIKKNLPQVISKGLDMILGFSETVLANVPKLVSAGMEMLKSIVQGLIASLPELIAKAPQIIINFANTISQSMTTIFAKGAEIIWELIKGIIGAIPDLIANLPKIVEAIFAVWNAINWWNLGKNLISGVKEGIKNAWTSLKESVTNLGNELKTKIDDVFLGIKNSAINIWNGIKTGISNVVTGIKNFIVNIFNSIKSFIDGIWTGIKNVTSTIWNGITSVISGAINVAKNIVSSAVNGIKSTVSGVWNGIKSVTSSVWNGIKNAITSPIETAKGIIKGIIDTIKGFFNFKISWPKIPLPHFSIKPKGWGIGDLLKGKIPSLGIDWYAKGGIFDEPTIFPTAHGLKGVGEAGAEAVAPIDVLLGYVRQAVKEENANNNYYIQKLIDLLSDFIPQIVTKMDRPIVLDDGTLVGRIAPSMDLELGEINRGKGRGR
ncbi:phage tail protein [Thomasclavelia ramosa]|uniref:Uncharacterized protein n=1 Tax=Thomasclavelia ramosa TaxID=1547 RepID=A0A3E3EAN6_9FIRM|nr:hypothetical protein [Thomasclavelia ramosa]RGD80342.1 hypothetical protein DXB93_15310 [Thomasclavelia ramosa]